MSWFRSTQPRRKATSCRPKIDILEDRCTPAVTFNVAGDTLFVTGDGGNNFMLMTDTGDGNAGNITVHTENGLFTPAPAVAIKRIVVDGQGGDDSVSYTVNNNFNSEMLLEGTLGDGNDALSVTMRQLQANSRLRVNVNAGNGNDLLLAYFLGSLQNGASIDWRLIGGNNDDRTAMTLTGNLLAGANLTSNVDLGDGNDGWDALLQGSLFNNALLQLNTTGGAGNDVVDSTFRTSHLGGSRTRINYQGNNGLDNVRINAAYNVDVEAGAELTFQQNGGADADFVFLQHGGRVNGVVSALLDAETGNDTIRAYHGPSPGSNPTRNTDVWRVNGGDGNDFLLLQIVPAKDWSSAEVNGLITGGPGFDTCRRSPNVQANGCER